MHAQQTLDLDIPEADVPRAVPAAEFRPPGRGGTRYDLIGSPIGDLLVTSDGESLTGLYTNPSGQLGADWRRDPGVFTEAAEQLRAYLAGELRTFTLPLAPRGTAFQLRVWRQLTTIAYGSTSSYGAIAAALGSPTASRAVGMANGRNPISIIVPCHRVIGADGSLTGYGGGLPRKRHLLRLEGAAFRA